MHQIFTRVVNYIWNKVLLFYSKTIKIGSDEHSLGGLKGLQIMVHCKSGYLCLIWKSVWWPKAHECDKKAKTEQMCKAACTCCSSVLLILTFSLQPLNSTLKS